MKTIKVTPETMRQRHVQFAALQPYQKQLESAAGLPPAVMEKLAAHKVFPILVPKAYKGRSAGAPLRGEEGLIAALAECPPGDGPALHCHEQTTENFFVVEGEFEVSWGDKGEDSILLKPCDFLSVPAGVCRTFRNVSDKTGRLLALIQTTGDQSDPSAFTPDVERDVQREFGAEIIEKLRTIGLRFDAGIDAPRPVQPVTVDFTELLRQHPEKVIEHEGAAWRYMEAGSGDRVLVMLPGAQGTAEIHAEQLRQLASQYRVISLWYPGLAEPEQLADGLAGVLDRLGIDKVHLFGGSFGGYWAQFFAARHPQRVEKLYVATSFVDATVLQQRGKPAAELIATPAEALKQQRLAMVQQWPEGIAKATLLALTTKQDAENLKARIVGLATARPVPALDLPAEKIIVIDCEDDPIIPPAVRQQVRDRYAKSKHYLLPRGGHFPALTNAQAVTDILRGNAG
ncbi:alpha/beta fold hydrolase [Variovorax sp. Sphag1AA]|uniref:alpha/beta fold hydrolase n=1 Tax=Variovorax sp. Sphag1AA TaxID=2587027 RepID=UPI0016200424|nr:alpha/beta fold hydrolase [Variovorax sp. Sphag1AA]MBB3178736.1 pimeloyl-ACP methyl ester carboxylesterase/uncharacterized RmlC-like cupin family protein [Variovorax sp. Sphag1AA]